MPDFHPFRPPASPARRSASRGEPTIRDTKDPYRGAKYPASRLRNEVSARGGEAADSASRAIHEMSEISRRGFCARNFEMPGTVARGSLTPGAAVRGSG